MKMLMLINPETTWRADSLGGALANMAIFAIAGVALLLICFKLFDKAIPRIDFEAEIAKIKSAGIKILEERVLPDGRRVCFFEGPQGVRLEFLEWK